MDKMIEYSNNDNNHKNTDIIAWCDTIVVIIRIMIMIMMIIVIP